MQSPSACCTLQDQGPRLTIAGHAEFGDGIAEFGTLVAAVVDSYPQAD